MFNGIANFGDRDFGDRGEFPAREGSAIEVTPGLAASAEVRTDKRRVKDYLLRPLERAVSKAGRER